MVVSLDCLVHTGSPAVRVLSQLLTSSVCSLSLRFLNFLIVSSLVLEPGYAHLCFTLLGLRFLPIPNKSGYIPFRYPLFHLVSTAHTQGVINAGNKI